MRLVLDACVLFPGRLRDILLGVAERGGFTPLWSARILKEWARATRRLPDCAEAAARFEIARLEREWPDACIDVPEALLDQLFLPDENDRHVLAAAIGGKAEGLLTLNRADFPPRVLARHGILLRDPDGLLVELCAQGIDVAAAVDAVRAEPAMSPRAMLKRIGLPRLGKLLDEIRNRI